MYCLFLLMAHGSDYFICNFCMLKIHVYRKHSNAIQLLYAVHIAQQEIKCMNRTYPTYLIFSSVMFGYSNNGLYKYSNSPIVSDNRRCTVAFLKYTSLSFPIQRDVLIHLFIIININNCFWHKTDLTYINDYDATNKQWLRHNSLKV